MTLLHGDHGDDAREPDGTTLPRLMRRRAGEHGARDFLRAKRHGVWAAVSWDAALAKVETLARAMLARGVQRGDVVAVIGENLPEAYLVQYAALCVGAAATHLYPDASAAELGYVLKDSGAVLLFAEDQEQVDKFLQVGDARAGVLGVVYLDGRGLWDYDDPLLFEFERFVAEAPADAASCAALDACIDAGRDEDLAALCYTSGTTGSRRACASRTATCSTTPTG